MFNSQITREQKAMGEKPCWSVESRKSKKRGIKRTNKRKKEGNKKVYCQTKVTHTCARITEDVTLEYRNNHGKKYKTMK